MTDEEILKVTESTPNLAGMTGNERLYATGLLQELDKCKIRDKKKARFILECLEFDSQSIEKILQD